MKIDWSSLDKVIYINLKERTDRCRSIVKELRALGIPEDKIYRLEATRHLIGQIGCAISHRRAIEAAVINGWGNVLIVEDDMVFNKDTESEAHLNYFMQTLDSVSWHVAFLSANYRKVITLKSTTKLVKPIDALCACAYIVNANYHHVMYDIFDQAIKCLRAGGWKYAYAIDVCWLPFMQRDSWIGIYPVAGHQAPGRSDIENSVMDYTEHFYKDIAAIAI